jgi:Fe-S cluster assembly iron-binding protein IscA
MGLVLDELAENEQNLVKDNGVNIVYDRRLKNYIDGNRGITIDYNDDKYGSGFIITGASAC